jgi:hypothetical protein
MPRVHTGGVSGTQTRVRGGIRSNVLMVEEVCKDYLSDTCLLPGVVAVVILVGTEPPLHRG